IAQFLAERSCADLYSLWVCEDLGGSEERVRHWTPGSETAELNVVVLLRNSATQGAAKIPLLGIPEQELVHRPSGAGRDTRCSSDGLITRREARLLAIAHLELHAGDTIWDIGAGSGSVGIEAARLSSELKVFAIEKDPQALQNIWENVARFGVLNVQVTPGE